MLEQHHDLRAIIVRLRNNESALRARGVVHAGVFGSRARGDHRLDSDTDILIAIDPGAEIGVFEYAGIKEYIASMFDGPVDVLDRDALKPFIRPGAMSDAVFAIRAASCRTLAAGHSTPHRSGPSVLGWHGL